MRIITGSARGVKLSTLEGEATRPTAERTKEALFSIIQFELENKSVFEPFGGSGQLSLEALSRGASGAFISDLSNDACEIIKQNAKKTKLFEKTRIVCSDYKAVIKGLSGREKFGIVFLDPPYKGGILEDSLVRIAEGGLVSEGGLVICESEKELSLELSGFTVIKTAKYSRAYITIYRKDAL